MISKDETQMADYGNVQHPWSWGKCNSKLLWHFITPVRLAKINNKWQLMLKRMWEKGNTYSFCKLLWTLWESMWRFLMKQKIDLSWNQQYQACGYSQRTLYSTAETLVHQGTLLLYSYYLEIEEALNVCQQMNGSKKCGTLKQLIIT